ncbi:MAG: SAM-dependent chlorinase/fluorinase, partial [Bryobacteraceae bacterium]
TIVTLTTDFGTSDHFVGSMKGVILGIAPMATIIDITHEIQPFAIEEAAVTLAQAYRYYPKKTIHVVVVDPGVGSARRPVVVAAAGQYFVGPDNGVFSIVCAAEKWTARHTADSRYYLKTVSSTFHGRDIFAPVAAHLARGVPPSKLGPKIDDLLHSNWFEPQQSSRRVWTGAVLKMDRFGNLITNLKMADFDLLNRRAFEVRIGMERIHLAVPTYATAQVGELFVIEGSSGYIEVCANQGAAGKILGCGAGAPVEVEVW